MVERREVGENPSTSPFLLVSIAFTIFVGDREGKVAKQSSQQLPWHLRKEMSRVNDSLPSVFPWLRLLSLFCVKAGLFLVGF